MRYELSTEGIRVRVEPAYSLAESDPAEDTFVFTYRVELQNQGHVPARLLFRHWLIHDSAGEDTEVEGEGVVGQQPSLEPGAAHRYRSFCVLRSPAGYMEGFYTFERPDGVRFQVAVPRFTLTAPVRTLSDGDDGEVVIH